MPHCEYQFKQQVRWSSVGGYQITYALRLDIRDWSNHLDRSFSVCLPSRMPAKIPIGPREFVSESSITFQPYKGGSKLTGLLSNTTPGPLASLRDTTVSSLKLPSACS